jgi:hypothetical protein
LKGRKFLVLVCDWKEREARSIRFTTQSERTRKVCITTRSARAITSRYARKKFGFHHIDGAIQNKAQILVRLRRRETENPRGFSTVFATKRIARDPAKAGSMFSEHSSCRLRANLFLLLPASAKATDGQAQKLKQ